MSRLATLSFREACSEMRDCGGTLRSPDSSEEKIVCPKPQRLAVTNLKSKPIRQLRSLSPISVDSSDAGCEIMDIFLSKYVQGESPKFGCSPPHFSGSPPSRAGNPLVRDAQFLHRHHVVYHHHPAAAMAQAKAGGHGTTGPPQHRASPSIRIEGFDCSAARGFECAGRDSGRRVPAFA